jgi:hypothetical protein
MVGILIHVESDARDVPEACGILEANEYGHAHPVVTLEQTEYLNF